MPAGIRDIKPAAFFFDLDGTLIDSEMLWTRAIVSWLASYGAAATAEDIAPIVFGHSWLDIHAELKRLFRAVLPESSAMEDAVELRSHFSRVASDPAASVIGTSVEFFKKAAEIAPCAIVSGSPHDDVVAAAKLCGIDSLTAFVLGAEEYARGKPAPDGYLLAAEKMGADPSKCIVVEDSTVGVESGLAAGMNVIGLDRNRNVRQEFSGCFMVVHDLSEVVLQEGGVRRK